MLGWYEKYKDLIQAVYVYGSRANPYIHNPDDYDYAVFAKDTSSYQLLLEHKYDLDEDHIHIVLFNIEDFKPGPKEAGDYIHYYMYPLVGFWDKANYNILYYEYEYRDVLRGLAPTFPYEDALEPAKTNKRWYYVLQGLFILDNYSYKLTAEQEEIVNLAHQGKCPRYWYEWAYKKLGLEIKKTDPNTENLATKPKKFIIRSGKKVWL